MGRADLDVPHPSGMEGASAPLLLRRDLTSIAGHVTITKGTTSEGQTREERVTVTTLQTVTSKPCGLPAGAQARDRRWILPPVF